MSVPHLHRSGVQMLTGPARLARLFPVALVSLLVLAGCRAGAPAPVDQGLGCEGALAVRSQALAALEQATQQAVERNRARTAQLQGVAKQAAAEIAAAVDLAPCDDGSPATGTVVDLADLRGRYRVIHERASAELDALASQPVAPARAAGTNDGKGGGKKGSKGD